MRLVYYTEDTLFLTLVLYLYVAIHIILNNLINIIYTLANMVSTYKWLHLVYATVTSCLVY